MESLSKQDTPPKIKAGEDPLKYLRRICEGLVCDEDHRYFYHGIPFQSVSKFIEHLETHPFNMAEKLSEEPFNSNPTEQQADWERIGREAREKGHEIHEDIANLLMYGTKPSSIYTAEIESVAGFLYKYIYPYYSIVAIEQSVHAGEEYRLAGTVDLLLQNKSPPHNYAILDWKTTSKSLTSVYPKNRLRLLNQYKYEDGTIQPLEYPADRLHKYTMQLSLYAMLLELNGFPIEACLIAVIKPTPLAAHWFTPKIPLMLEVVKAVNQKAKKLQEMQNLP